MKNKHIWPFIISLIVPLLCFSQEKNEVGEEKAPKVYALRLGLDLIKPALTQFGEDYQGLELVGDLRLNNRIYVAAELGSERKTQQSEQINFTTNGSYIKLGVDYNFFNNWKGMNNALYAGFRLSRSLHTHQVNSYTLYQTNQYLPIYTTEGYLTGERAQLSSSWFELLFGTKVELFPNFYAGISIRMHALLNNNQPQDFGNLHAPGFNKITDDNKFGAGINYTIAYAFPFRFKKEKTKAE